MALRSGLIEELSAAGASGDERGERGTGVEGLIVRFVLPAVRLEWSGEGASCDQNTNGDSV